MRILCACNCGNVRSVGLASRLKKLRYDAIAVGAHITSIDTLRYLINWADRIVDLSDDGRMEHMLAEEEKGKYIRYSVGKDVWGNPRHEDLHRKLDPIVDRLLKETISQ